jgi:hypothetical protein
LSGRSKPMVSRGFWFSAGSGAIVSICSVLSLSRLN